MQGTEIKLTRIEYNLLCLLAQNTGKVLTHDFILEKIWPNTLDTDIQSLRVFMASLRKRIEKDPSNPKYIQTHIGIGYRLLRIMNE
jgi:two-component system KDP operon response regulator KdpE